MHIFWKKVRENLSLLSSNEFKLATSSLFKGLTSSTMYSAVCDLRNAQQRSSDDTSDTSAEHGTRLAKMSSTMI